MDADAERIVSDVENGMESVQTRFGNGLKLSNVMRICNQYNINLTIQRTTIQQSMNDPS